MFRYFLLLSMLVGSVSASIPIAFAASSDNPIQVAVLDPTALTLKEAKRLCREESALLKCDIVREELRQKRRGHKVLKKATMKRHKEHKLRYNVFNANFE